MKTPHWTALWKHYLPHARIRVRIVAAVVLAMTAVLLVASGFVYWRVTFALDRQLNQDLSAYTDLVESGLEGWSALFLERTLDSGPAISGLGPGIFAAAMATGRLLSQRVEGPSVASRILFAGSDVAPGVGDLVLLKASRGVGLDRAVELLARASA